MKSLLDSVLEFSPQYVITGTMSGSYEEGINIIVAHILDKRQSSLLHGSKGYDRYEKVMLNIY